MCTCRWRLFRWPIIAQPSKVVLYTQAAISLHNYLRTTESSVYCPPGFIDGEDSSFKEDGEQTKKLSQAFMEPVTRTNSIT